MCSIDSLVSFPVLRLAVGFSTGTKTEPCAVSGAKSMLLYTDSELKPYDPTFQHPLGPLHDEFKNTLVSLSSGAPSPLTVRGRSECGKHIYLSRASFTSDLSK